MIGMRSICGYLLLASPDQARRVITRPLDHAQRHPAAGVPGPHPGMTLPAGPRSLPLRKRSGVRAILGPGTTLKNSRLAFCEMQEPRGVGLLSEAKRKSPGRSTRAGTRSPR
jgi:hypothetical protein